MSPLSGDGPMRTDRYSWDRYSLANPPRAELYDEDDISVEPTGLGALRFLLGVFVVPLMALVLWVVGGVLVARDVVDWTLAYWQWLVLCFSYVLVRAADRALFSRR